MNKSDLIRILGDKAGLPLNRAEAAVNEVIEAMTQALARGERIEIRGFGSWVARQYGARNARNPRTGETVAVPAKRAPYFKAGKELSDRIMEAWQRQQDQKPDP